MDLKASLLLLIITLGNKVSSAIKSKRVDGTNNIIIDKV